MTKKVIPFETNPRRQLVISERSDLDDLRGWLKSGTRDVAYVVAAAVDDIVVQCVEIARGFGVRIEYAHPNVESAMESVATAAAA